ncbi:MAG: response regulator transcription factor [Bacteroidota bacterium]|jgi:DNA-binding NarL/FixJ family response regulator
MNILIADDSSLIRSRLIKLISTVPNVSVVAEAEDGEEAVQLIQSHRPDLAILDLRMPKLNGLEVTAHAKRNMDLKVFIVTNFYDSHSVSSAKSAGADYVFDKSSDMDVLLKFITLYAELI